MTLRAPIIRPSRRPIAKLIVSICALLVPLGPAWAEGEASPAVAEMGPREVVEDTVAKVLAILADEALDTETRRARIEAIAFDVFDFTTMSKLVLARNWKRFTQEQRYTFVREFKAHLSRSYGSRLDRYRQERVDIVSTREEPRGDVTVVTRVRGGQFDDIEMRYRLRYRNERWRAIDVVIEGVSLIANFRSQFAEVLSKGGPESLIEQLRTKNFETPGLDEDDAEDAGEDAAAGEGA
jgi:phospholipid transport system substrate-binding protein